MATTTQKQTLPGLAQLKRRLKHANWPLILGGVLVLLVTGIALFGPALAPRDPMQENYTLQVDGKIRTPPYPPFSVAGYPLGTDRFGRDLVSRLLWGVRPTLIMVVSVAAVRMVFGIFLGLTIGWAEGRVGRWLDSLLSLSLSIPLLIVALIGIAAVGVDKGLIAFIVGLSLTGWAETARLISEQTRMVKSQVYIEAAHALGASDTRILFYHVLRQIMPLVGMLLAFEVSGTLLVAAELGFLGYYIGGGVWIDVYDNLSVNTAGLPELGEMLSTALIKLTDPSALIVIGSVLFFSILGFNLLGEGLRLQLSQERLHGRVHTTWLGEWLEERIFYPLLAWSEENALRIGVTAVFIAAIGGTMLWYASRPVTRQVQAAAIMPVPGDHQWAAQMHDAHGTRFAPVTGPQRPVLLWTFDEVGGENFLGYVGTPVVAQDGTIYLVSRTNNLLAISHNGKLLWNFPLPDGSPAGPALGPNGEIYVTDLPGGLWAVSPEGEELWHFESQNTARPATSSPIVGQNGTIYYTLIDTVQAVSPEGQPVWRSYVTNSYVETPPRLSPQGGMIFLKDGALASDSGAPVALNGLPSTEGSDFTDTSFVVGADGNLYYQYGHEVYPWRSTSEGLRVDPPFTWNYQGKISATPADVGVTPNGLVWLFYVSGRTDTRMIWIDREGKLVSDTRLPERGSVLAGIDQLGTAYICANAATYYGISCKGLDPLSGKILWEIIDPNTTSVTGAALVEGRIYVLTGTGLLFAFGDR